MKCHQVQKYLHASLDGELGADQALEIEKHLEDCGRCRQQMDFEVAFIDTVRRTMRDDAHDGELERRVRRALDGEDRRRRTVTVLTRVGGLALAASLVLAVGVVVRGAVVAKPGRPALAISEELVSRHARQMPLEVSGGDAVQVAKWFEGKVDFPVNVPVFAPDRNVHLLGARLSRVDEKDAAQLVYDAGGHRVSLLIFDPGDHAGELDAQAVARDAKAIPKKQGWVTTHRGYSIGLYQDRGIAYTVTSDVAERDMLSLISSISH